MLRNLGLISKLYGYCLKGTIGILIEAING